MPLPLTEALEELIGLGVEGPALIAAMRRLETVTYETRITTLEEAVAEASARADADLARLTEKRLRDAERKRVQRMSADSRGTSADAPRPLPSSPQTPQQPTPTPGDITTRARGGASKPNGFARFWEAYPHKVGKAAAEKAYVRAIGKIGGHDPPAVLLAGVERARASREWGEGFIPHPTTWLNQGRWEDEPAEVITLQPRKAHERPHQPQQPTAREDRLGRMLRGAMAAVDEREA